MSTFTMIDVSTAPTHDKAMKALAAATKAAGTEAPGAWAFYLGGPAHNRGRGSTYTNDLLDQLEASGVVLLPIFVGRQKNLSHDRGVADVADALVLHKQFRSRNTMIVTDVERSTSERDPMAAVRYVEGWTAALHAKGLQAMAYGSFNLAADLAKHANPAPDAIWVARYRSHEADTKHQPHDIPGVPNNSFVGRRAWQYGGAFRDHPDDKKETPARAAGLVCDISSVHAVVFDGVKTAKKTAKGAVKTPTKTPSKTTKKATGPTPVKPKPLAGVHVVVSHDTTFGLEDHFGLRHGSLFAANSKVMDAAARQHGHADSQRGRFIFPGTRLVIPAS